MADTVKKSRIVSEDDKDLGEALLEEFNIRLKNCMSQDDLQKEEDPPEPGNNIYEKLGTSQKISTKSHIEASRMFIRAEIEQEENYYDDPKSLSSIKQNGHREVEYTHREDDIYENIPEKTDSTDQKYVLMVDSKEQDLSNVDVSSKTSEIEEYEDMGGEGPSPNLYESVELKQTPAEAVDLKPAFNLPTTSFTDFSEQKSPDLEGKSSSSVKDRMLLSCDDTSTLLFTQTVTSPMLTPSEENIDFLKGFQGENTISESTVSNSSPPKEFEVTETSPEVSEPSGEDKPLREENFYENAEFYKNTTPENVYENLRVDRSDAEGAEAEENIYERLDEVENEIKTLELEENDLGGEEDIYQNIEECLGEDRAGAVLKTGGGKSQDTDDGSLEEFIRNEREVSEGFLKEDMSKVDEETVNNGFQEKKDDAPVDVQVASTAEDLQDLLRSVLEDPEPLRDCQITVEPVERVQADVGVVESNDETNPEHRATPRVLSRSHPDVAGVQKHEECTDAAPATYTLIGQDPKEKIPAETYKELIYHQRSESSSNYYEKYTEVVTKNSKNETVGNREKDTETVPAEIVKNLKSQFQCKSAAAEVAVSAKKDGGNKKEGEEPKSASIVDQIKNKFEHGREVGAADDSTEYSETVVETNAPGERCIKKKKTKKTRKEEKENVSVTENGHVDGENFYNVNVKSLKSSFSKFDALQKKNVLHIRSSDSAKAQEKFSNGAQIEMSTSCKACGKQVFQMEQIKAEKALWHKNCFRCTECSKQLTVDTYESNEGTLYCKPHFKALFAPRVVEDEAPPSDKPDLGLEELQSLNVKERFQVFEHYRTQTEALSETEKGGAPLNVKRSPSILSKLARFQKHGMDVGVTNEALDGVPIEESTSEEEAEEGVQDGEDPDLVRAKRVQKEKPFHFTGMSDVKKRWEHGDHAREERREETKQEIQNIRNRLFMGKQEKMKEAYQQAIMESESSANLRKNLNENIEACDTKSIKERYEKGQFANERVNSRENRNDEEEVYESEISKKSRSLFLELDATASKPPQVSPVTPPKLEVKKAREAYLAKTAKEDTVKSSEYVEEVEVKTADIQERFKFFETYKEPEKERRQFRITPPRDPSQVKTETPEREIYRDPDVIRSEEFIDDSKIAKESHTASKMLNKFRQMEENLTREPEAAGPKPLKRFTPPPEPAKQESHSEEEESSEYEDEEEEEEVDHAGKLPEDLIEAQKAARAKQLRAKFEKWEANEVKKEQQNQSVNVVEEFGEEQTQIESTRVIRAKFESMKETSSDQSRAVRVRPNRFV